MTVYNENFLNMTWTHMHVAKPWTPVLQAPPRLEWVLNGHLHSQTGNWCWRQKDQPCLLIVSIGFCPFEMEEMMGGDPSREKEERWKQILIHEMSYIIWAVENDALLREDVLWKPNIIFYHLRTINRYSIWEQPQKSAFYQEKSHTPSMLTHPCEFLDEVVGY
jgi:hypothetical protein